MQSDNVMYGCIKYPSTDIFQVNCVRKDPFEVMRNEGVFYMSKTVCQAERLRS